MGGVFTITGVLCSFDGGVCGGLEVSTWAPCESRRKRSEDAAAFVTSRAGSMATFDALGDDSGLPVSTNDLLSGLGLPVPEELFFLKTSRNLPTGDAER